MPIPFIDLQAQREQIAPEIEAAVKRVIEHGAYILGPEVSEFEAALSDFEGEGTTVSCANGTDAIVLPMMAWGIGPGDAVFCPSFTYTATAEAIATLGATPVFVDICEDIYTMCPNSLEAAIVQVKQQNNWKPKAIICVDLFGQPANYHEISPIAKAHGLKLISDNAQGLGCRLGDKSPIEWADAMTTSFFPAKPLGCYGDGGAVIVKDTELYDKLISLRFHGRGTEPYDHNSVGLNSRLDTIQAAILIEKLKIFDSEINKRNQIASKYSEALSNYVTKIPKIIDGGLSIWSQYVIEVDNRDAFMTSVKAQDVPIASYYPRPTHLQTAYQDYPFAANGLSVTERVKDHVCALPMHAYLDEATQDIIVKVVIKAAKETT